MSSAAKIVSMELAVQIREQLHSNGLTLGVCHGCFDILHTGHVHYFAQAAERVDVLLVSITAAQHINKGQGRPVFGDDARLSVVSALSAVDFVLLNQHPTAVPLIQQVRPHFYFKGADYSDMDDPRLIDELDALRKAEGTFALTDGSVLDSSSRAAKALLKPEAS